MVNKEGTLRSVSKFGGLVFKDEPDKWYNPDKSKSEDMLKFIKDKNIVKKDEVELTLNDGGYYTSIDISKRGGDDSSAPKLDEVKVGENKAAPSEENKNWDKINLDKQKAITKGQVLNLSVEIWKENKGHSDVSPENQLKDIMGIAKDLWDEINNRGYFDW